MKADRVVEVIAGLGLGGAERALHGRLALRREDVNTLVISTRADLGDLNDEVAAVANLQVLDVGRFATGELLRAIVDFNPDVVLVHNPLEAIRLISRMGRALAVPVVPVAHSDRVTFRPGLGLSVRLASRLTNARAAGHIAVSQAAAFGDQCRGSRHIEVAHLGAHVDLDATPRDVWPEGTRIRLAFVGRFVAPKNLKGLVEAVAMAADDLRAAQAHLVLAGYGPEEDAIRASVIRLSVADLVTVLPRVSDPSGILRRADGLIISSSHEGGPLTAYEAAQMGVRILGTPVGVVPEVLADDRESVLLSNASSPMIAQGLRSLVAKGPLDASERSTRQLSGARWSLDRCAEGFYRAVERVIEAS